MKQASCGTQCHSRSHLQQSSDTSSLSTCLGSDSWCPSLPLKTTQAASLHPIMAAHATSSCHVTTPLPAADVASLPPFQLHISHCYILPAACAALPPPS